MTTIRVIFWLIVVGTILGLIASRYKKKGGAFPWLRALITLAATALILFTGSCVYKSATAPEKPKVVTSPPATKVVKVGMQPTLHRFSDYPESGIALKIEVYDFRVYPKGGSVTAFPPKGQPYVDTPGVDVKTHFTPGLWRWVKKDPSAIGVEVWQ